MSNFFKCKFYKKFKLFIGFHPLHKILKFKKAKWVSTQKRLLRLNSKLFLFYKKLNRARIQINKPPRTYLKSSDLIAFRVFSRNLRRQSSIRYLRLLRRQRVSKFYSSLFLTKEQKSRLFFNRNNSRLSQSKQGSAVVVNIDKPRLLSNVRRLKKDYKSATLVLNSFKHYLGQRVSIKKLKRNLSFYKFSKFAFFTKFVFNLNVLLHQLNLFENQKQLFLAVRLDKILKNKIPVGFSSELVKGDVIQVQSPFFFKVGLNENVPFFYSFCEIDLYSNTLVILKDFHELRSNTSNMFIKYLVNISLFVHYLRKK